MIIEKPTERKRPAHTAESGASGRLARILKASALIAAVFGFQGCGDHDALPPDITKQAVKFDEVPENVRAAAKKAIPGVNLNEAWKNLERGGKLHSYEIRGKNASDGKTREVRVSLAGKILEME
jgi:hypothetical protein